MASSKKRILLRVALIGTAPCLLLTGLWCLFLINSINPMQIAFITDFEIENRTGQVVWVTPVGTFRTGRKSVLPQFALAFPAIPAWHSRDLRIGAGKRRRIYYDCDDINFSEIVVRDSTGTVAVRVVDANPRTNGYYANKLDLYEIENIGDLQPPTPSITAAIAPPQNRTIFWSFAIIGLVAPFLFGWLRREISKVETPDL